MINLAIAIGIFLSLSLGGSLGLDLAWWFSIPFGLVAGFIAFWMLGRKIQEKMDVIMAQMQKDLAEQKLDRAIATLETGFAYEKRQLFIGAQLHSQIGMIHYIKKEHEKALEHFKVGFPRHYMAQTMMAAIYFKRKDYDAMKKTLDITVKTCPKEAFVYAVYAYFLCELKEREAAMEKLQAGLAKIPNDERLTTNLTNLQNDKKMKMKLFGDVWLQLMLERPKIVQQQQNQLPHMRMSRKAMFR